MEQNNGEVSQGVPQRLGDLAKVIPVKGKLLVKAIAQKEKELESGLIETPKNEKIEWRIKGEVIKVGFKTFENDEEMANFGEDNIVFFKYFNEDKLEWNGEQYYLIDYPKQVICSFGRKEEMPL